MDDVRHEVTCSKCATEWRLTFAVVPGSAGLAPPVDCPRCGRELLAFRPGTLIRMEVREGDAWKEWALPG